MLILAGAILIFAALGQRCLWQDEAETALLARNILRFGKPVAFDGVNLVSQEAGREFGPDHVWRWSPWLQFYLAAASLRVFGMTTFAARLPFAICGVVTLMATYIAAARAFLSAAVARLSIAFLATSVPFLLHVRQARWHAPAYLLIALLLIAVMSVAAGSQPAGPAKSRPPHRSVALFIFAATLLFYMNYFVAICAIAAIAAAAPLLARDRRFLVRMAIAIAVTVLLSIPGALYFQIFSRGASTGAAQTMSQLGFYVMALPVPMLAIAAWIGVTARAAGDARRVIAFLIAFAGFYVAAISLGPWRMFRFVTPLLPATAILSAVVAAWMMQWKRSLGIVVVILLVAIDAQYRPLLAYLGEITRGVHDADCAVCDQLRAHALPTDVVLATYGDLPIEFYTSLRVTGGLQGQPLPENPDWILFRGFVMAADPMKDLRVRNFVKHLDLTRYARVLEIPDPPLANTPDPQFHRFSDVTDERKLVLLRKR